MIQCIKKYHLLLIILIVFIKSISNTQAQNNQQSFRSDTVFLDFRNDSIMRLSLQLNAEFKTKFSNGKILLTSIIPTNTCSKYLATYIIDIVSYTVDRVIFKNFPKKTLSDKIPIAPDDFIFLPESNIIIWFQDYNITITDTLYNYIHSCLSPYDTYYKKHTQIYNSSAFIMDSFVVFPIATKGMNTRASGKVLINKGIQTNAGFGLVLLKEIIRYKKKRIRFSKIVKADFCEPVVDTLYQYNRSYFPDTNHQSLWFTNDFSRHVIHYFYHKNSFFCYRLPHYILKNNTDYFQIPKQINDAKFPHACLIGASGQNEKIIGRLYQDKIAYLPDVNLLLRVFTLATDNLRLFALLDSLSYDHNGIQRANEVVRKYQVFQYLSIEDHMEIVSQLIVPVEDCIDLIQSTGKEWVGFKRIFDGEYFRPAMVRLEFE